MMRPTINEESDCLRKKNLLRRRGGGGGVKHLHFSPRASTVEEMPFRRRNFFLGKNMPPEPLELWQCDKRLYKVAIVNLPLYIQLEKVAFRGLVSDLGEAVSPKMADKRPRVKKLS